ncbi:MAG: DUF3341 domain-containing protein, partial [Pseudomonadota bacterium]
MIFKNLADYGIYPRRSIVKRAANLSKDPVFSQADNLALQPERVWDTEFVNKKETKTLDGIGIATGAGAGAAVGGALGWLMGIGFLAIPGVGPFIAIDPIMVALVGAGTGSLFGGIAGAMIGIGVSA